MLSELAPTIARSTVEVKPSELLLQQNSWVKFSKTWGADQEYLANNVFQVINQPLVVRYPISRKAPAGHYATLDLSNTVNPPSTTPAATANFSWQLYPIQKNVLYQIAVGLKKGNYFVQTFIPSNKYIYTTGSTSIYPDFNSSIWRYLGVKYPKDSPEEAPVWYLYTVWNMVPIILELYCDGQDVDKMTLVFKINKCQLKQIQPSDPKYAEANARAMLIPYYTDLVGF
jgi:hypothetical protein